MGILNIFRVACNLLKGSQANASHVAKIQEHRLRAILRHAVTHSDYYRSLYHGIDIDNCRLDDLPVVTKAEIVKNFDRIVTDKRLKYQEVRNWLENKKGSGHLYLNEFIPFLTSGSTTETALIIYNRCAMDVVHAAILARQPFEREPSPRNALDVLKIIMEEMLARKTRMAVVAVPGGPVHTVASSAPAFHWLILKEKVFSLLDPVDLIVRELNEFQPDCLVTYSSMIDILAHEQLAGRLKIQFNHPRSFLTGCSEPLTETTKQLAWLAWKMRIQDTYGTSEWFIMGRSCKEYKHMHAMSDLCIMEIVDHNNKPVQTGQLGEKVLLTNFFNFVQPIIRYEITDVTGFAAETCKCGSPFPTLLPVQGRTDDILYISRPEGGYDVLHHYILFVALTEVAGLRQFQVAQTARNELTCYYVPQDKNDNLRPALNSALENSLSKLNFYDRLSLYYKQVDSIPRHENSGKYKPIVSQVGPPADLDN